MSKRNKIYFVMLLLLVLALICPQTTKASSWVINPEQAPISTDTEYCIGGVAPGGGVPADYIVEWQFAAGFDLSNLTIDDIEANSEVVFYTGTNNCSGGTARVTEDTPTADNDRDAATVTGQKVDITLEDAIGGGGNFSFKFRTQAGTSVVTPGSSGNYILIVRVFDDTGALALTDADLLYIGGANQLEIYATVDPTLTLTLSSTACDLDTLSITGLKTCSYDATVTTNATTGYTSYIRSDGQFKNATNNIADVGDGDVGVTNVGGDSTEEEYGVSTSKAGQTIAENDSGETCADLNDQLVTAMPASVLNTTDKSFASSASPIEDDSTTLCHAAVIMGTTPAGVYGQLVTVTVIGNF